MRAMLRHYLREAARAVTQFAFARRQYKLLLRTTLRDLDLRMQAVSAATAFFSTIVQPIVIEAPFGKSMLVVAPHQDDEAIGCGGAIGLQRRSERDVMVVVLQDGADEFAKVSMTREALREKRNAESRAAARLLEIEEPIFVGSRNLRQDAEATAIVLGQVIEDRQIDALFTPFVLDGHPDHRTCNSILKRALTNISRPIRILQYEVWATCLPNVVVVIDDVIEKKKQMLSCFEFANSAGNYLQGTLGLNMFNSRLVPAGRGQYVEAFFEMPREEYLKLVDAVESAELNPSRVYPSTSVGSARGS